MVAVRSANEAAWDDLRTVFGGTAARCWCQRYKLPRGEAFQHRPPLRWAVYRVDFRSCHGVVSQSHAGACPRPWRSVPAWWTVGTYGVARARCGGGRVPPGAGQLPFREGDRQAASDRGRF